MIYFYKFSIKVHDFLCLKQAWKSFSDYDLAMQYPTQTSVIFGIILKPLFCCTYIMWWTTLKKIWKTGQFRENRIRDNFFRENISPKNFSWCVDFKNMVFRKPDFCQKTGPGRPGSINDMRDHHIFTFWTYLNHRFLKM